MNTKIIATVGPACESYEKLKALIEEGVDIVRINFSHATQEQYLRIRDSLNRIKQETGKATLILQDLQGPRIRIGHLTHEVDMKPDEIYAFMYNEGNIDNLEIPIDHRELIEDIRPGEHFYISNGAIEMVVTEVRDNRIFARVERGGLVLSRKGINLPQTNLRQGGITEKDLTDARFGLENGVDFIALSFVQSQTDISRMRQFLSESAQGSQLPLPKIIAKIERATALPVIDEIIKAADGIMVARGDLGIEAPLEDLPIIQKNLIRHAHWHDKPAIVATEMMTSMLEHDRPTRAEVGDVANAIFDGADALMLSDETAIGRYPLQTVTMMQRILKRADDYFNNRNYFDNTEVIYKK